MSDFYYIFDDNDLRKLVMTWVQEQEATGHPSALKNAQFVGQQMITMLHRATHLQKHHVDPAATDSVAPSPAQEVDLSDMDAFRQLIGESWENLT